MNNSHLRVAETPRIRRIGAKTRDLGTLAVETIQTPVCTDPELRESTLTDRPDDVVAQTESPLAVPIVNETTISGVALAEAETVDTNPEEPRCIPETGTYTIAGEASRVSRIMTMVHNRAIVDVEQIQAAPIGADAHLPLFSLTECRDEAISETLTARAMADEAATRLVETAEAGSGRDPQVISAIPAQSSDLVIAQTPRVRRTMPVVQNIAFVRVQAVETCLGGADPDASRPIFEQSPDVVAAQRVATPGIMAVVPKPTRSGREPIEATPPRTDPDIAARILHQGTDDIVGEAVRLIVVMEEALAGLRDRVQTVETTESSHPDRSGAILEKALDLAVAQRRRIVGLVPKDLEIVAVVAIQAILGSDPEETTTIEQHALHGRLGKAVLE